MSPSPPNETDPPQGQDPAQGPGPSQEPGLSQEPRAAAVIVAAGESTRMGSADGKRKPFLELGGRRMLEHTCRAFDGAELVSEVVLVVHAEDVERVQRMCAEYPALAKVVVVVAGGASRPESVRNGVRWCGFDLDVILVHDGARPLIESECIDRAVSVAAGRGAALVAVPVTDTIKSIDSRGDASATIDRSQLWSAQTPQAFRAGTLRELVERASSEGFLPTDDAALYERYVGPVPIVEGSRQNMKITTPEDVLLAEAVLRARSNGSAPS